MFCPSYITSKFFFKTCANKKIQYIFGHTISTTFSKPPPHRGAKRNVIYDKYSDFVNGLEVRVPTRTNTPCSAQEYTGGDSLFMLGRDAWCSDTSFIYIYLNANLKSVKNYIQQIILDLKKRRFYFPTLRL